MDYGTLLISLLLYLGITVLLSILAYRHTKTKKITYWQVVKRIPF